LKNFLAFYQHFLHTHLWVNVFSLIWSPWHYMYYSVQVTASL
jgi:hypothetical protein